MESVYYFSDLALLSSTYFFCIAIKIFSNLNTSSFLRNKIIEDENERSINSLLLSDLRIANNAIKSKIKLASAYVFCNVI